MANVVFVAPYFLDTTLRFLAETLFLEGIQVGLISQDPVDRLPPRLRAALTADWRIQDGLDPNQIHDGVVGIAGKMGRVDRVIGALEQLQVPLAQVRDRLGIPGVNTETAENFRDKAKMKTVLQAAGIPCARHLLVETADRAREFVAAVGYPVVVKPPAGAGARQTFRVDGETQFEQVMSWLPPSPARPVLIEEFVTGEEHSFDSVMIGGEPIWFSVSDYHPSPLTVLENPWIQWCVLLPREVDRPRYGAIRETAAQALRVLGLKTGLSHMEWFRRPDGSIAISEVGARPPGAQFTTLISYAHELNLYRAWVELMVFDRFEPPARNFAVGAAYIRGMGQGHVVAVRGVRQAQAELGELVVEARLPRPGQPASGSYEGEGYVILKHADTQVVRNGLERLVSLLRVELEEPR